MTPSDEQELHRLSTALAQISASLPPTSPLRESLVKAGLTLSIAFIDGKREWIEDTYAQLESPFTAEQQAQLLSLAADPPAQNKQKRA